MELNTKKHGSTIIIQLSGELDHHTSEMVRYRIDRSYKEGESLNIILDLRNVSFMDSSGIGLIMGRFQKVKSKNGSLLIVSDSKYVNRILDMSGLLKIINLYPSVETAKKYVKGGEVND